MINRKEKNTLTGLTLVNFTKMFALLQTF